MLCTVDEIIDLWKVVPKELYNMVGFCIDTCHLFVTSHTTNNTMPLYNQIMLMIKAGVPIGLVHLNDSATVSQDKHADILKGKIEKTDMINIIKLCYERGIPMCMERMDIKIEKQDDLKRLLERYKGLIVDAKNFMK
jgi:endonuclease IV